jgi:hypothetical protein
MIGQRRWKACFMLRKQNIYLGTYASKQEAGVVWDAASVWRSMKAPGKPELAVHCTSAAGRD